MLILRGAFFPAVTLAFSLVDFFIKGKHESNFSHFNTLNEIKSNNWSVATHDYHKQITSVTPLDQENVLFSIGMLIKLKLKFQFVAF